MVLEGAEYEHLTFFNNQNFMKQQFLCFGHEMTDATKMIKKIVRTLDTFLIERGDASFKFPNHPGATEGVNCRLQVRVAGHCFTNADKPQALTNANTRTKE